ncbi:MAG: hypothetical protein AABX10_02140 [Nanoarchaeota archaeon]
MKFSTEEDIMATILYHLRRGNIIGGKHTHFDTLKRGFPKHLGKQVEYVAHQLIKAGWLLTKPTSYGLQVSLNKELLVEIEAFILKVLNLRL